jgi:hypothetical protein
MYVLVDRDKLVFRHAHPDHAVVSALSTIEVAHCAVCILPADPACMNTFTDLELRMLYQNTTGKKLEGYFRPALCKAVAELAMGLPVSDVNPFEVKQQASKISINDAGFYRYVKGAYTPARLQELFEPEALVAVPGATPASVPPAPPGATPASTPAAPIAPPATIAAPRGGNKAVIWATADVMWEQGGKVREVKAVLELRKRIMDQLEQQGIKRTSASSELGNWQKVRLNG